MATHSTVYSTSFSVFAPISSLSLRLFSYSFGVVSVRRFRRCLKSLPMMNISAVCDGVVDGNELKNAFEKSKRGIMLGGFI